MSRTVVVTGCSSGFGREVSERLARRGDRVYATMRGVDGKNVLDFDKAMRAEIKRKLADNGLAVLGIGSPIGKVKLSEPFEPHFERFKIAVELAEFFDAP